MASGSVSHLAVEPSMSVKRNVTVPDGNPMCGVSHGPPGVPQTKHASSGEMALESDGMKERWLPRSC
jgi:hypothetical protein